MRGLFNCGVLFRGWTEKPDEVKNVVERLFLSTGRAFNLGFTNIIVLVPKDKDCGKTVPILLEKLFDPSFLGGGGRFAVLEPKGNADSDALNAGIECLHEYGCKYAFTVSNKVVEHLMPGNVDKMLTAFREGTLVTGLALRDLSIPETEDDHYQGILEGLISNTFDAWDIDALLSVGGFDSQIGVEEIAPIIRLIKLHGLCVAPIFPTNQIGMKVSTLRVDRHKFVMTTKRTRQIEEASRAGESLGFICRGILPEYPK